MGKPTIVVRIDKKLFDRIKKWGASQKPPLYKDKSAVEALCKKSLKS